MTTHSPGALRWFANLETLQAWVQSQSSPFHRSRLADQAERLGVASEMSRGFHLAALHYSGVMRSTGERGYWTGTGLTLTGEEISERYEARKAAQPATTRSPTRVDRPAPLCATCGTQHPGEC